jgi:hypothetical protein
METKKKSVYEVLSAVDCREESRKKNGLTYLPWAWAWARVKENYPAAFYTIYEDANGRFYHTDGKTAWVKTGVTIEGLELIEYLPVMDYKNASIPLERVTSFDVNKSIQRSLTKACARHGLGLYIFAGEDLPEGAERDTKAEETAETPKSGARKGVDASAASGGTLIPPKAQTPSAAKFTPIQTAAKKAFDEFVKLDFVQGMDEKSVRTLFSAEVKTKSGKESMKAMTVEDWENVYAWFAETNKRTAEKKEAK